MTNCRKILAMLVALMMALTIIPMAAVTADAYSASGSFQNTDGDQVSWNLVDGELTISSAGSTGDFSIRKPNPWISYFCLTDKIIISRGVTAIGYCGLESYGDGEYESTVKKIELPDSLKTIEYAGFSGHDALRYIFVPKSVTTIGSYAFPGGGTSNADSLMRYVIFRGNAIELDANALMKPDDRSFTQYYPENNTSWKKLASDEVKPYRAAGYLGDYLAWLLEPDGTLTIMGDGVMPSYDGETTPWADYSDEINSIKIDEGVTGIEGSALKCGAATEISLPSTLTYVDAGAFWECYSINTINLAEENESFAVQDGVLYTADNSCLVYYPAGKESDSYQIPEGTEEIGSYAFCACTNLKSITIPESTTFFGKNIFTDCREDLVIYAKAGTVANAYATVNSFTFIESSDDSETTHAHSFSGWTITVPATEVSAGVRTRTCTVCGASETQAIAQLAPTLPAIKIVKPKAAKKKITVRWKKVSKNNLKKISKIQIEVATDPGFTNIVKTATASKKKTSKVIKGLQSKTKYYVRIRAYASGDHVSAWKTKSVKVK